ncbi:Mu transposase C-terminal domain-containing protein [Pseudoalteromonas peptidolytica]|uniref:Putative transposase n=1 Tax=Pseudoalteromonas peptidolytica F12-50-A1 TaxID=1315280 RepID=A0A8I0MT68_9GAMM|nr:Mu transposase C-terminal domain-containing protein [Pseudoalteromonas peptidolytica]MBE0344845.1 putative transposase [Pseudoalteromonas peptidolytica F12-50-A1]NLR16753.1 DDE-type integrase/transposase/recombinase [Pseudoalteromonas peptidolytica]GEK09035.1 transposase [Pseudoalteromonas peptidolytica]
MPRKKRKEFTLQQGSSAYHNGTHYIILQIINLDYVLAECFTTKKIEKLRISELSLSPPSPEEQRLSVIDAIEDDDWNIAQQRLEIIQPLVHKHGRTVDDVKMVATEHGLHFNTVYKWLRLYEADPSVMILTPKSRSDAGSTKLSSEVEKIIDECIENEYLNKQRKSVAAVHRLVQLECRKEGLKAPHVNTVRNRIKSLSEDLKIRKRFSKDQIHDALHMNQGEFPHADYPYAVIQIDHTPLDVIMVDDVYRLPLERPWITMAIDVYSRMVVGFYISFEKPSALSVGMCLANVILPKEKFLAEYDIDASWPCWGIPRTVHADNAKEFRGNMLKKACQEYSFTIEWRPVSRPHFGGHIERLLGTFAKEIHTLPGTTFSNIQQRRGYDSDKQSALTLKEFEHWLTVLITKSYHHKFHSGINTTPYQRFEEGVLGTQNTKGVGMPRKVEDEETLKINLLPYVERTVQDYGIRIDDICYYSDVLRVWVNATVEGRSKLKKKFICRRDPRDISTVWFFDPQLKCYFPIPYRNTAHPPMTIWELRKVQKKLKDDGVMHVNEDSIFSALETMREIEQEAVIKTKKSRKAVQRRKHAEKNAVVSPEPSEVIPNAQFVDEEDDDDIQPFDEMLEVRRD